jgi:hypothetical protein
MPGTRKARYQDADEHIRAVVDAMPPLTEAQLVRLAALLRPSYENAAAAEPEPAAAAPGTAHQPAPGASLAAGTVETGTCLEYWSILTVTRHNVS